MLTRSAEAPMTLMVWASNCTVYAPSLTTSLPEDLSTTAPIMDSSATFVALRKLTEMS